SGENLGFGRGHNANLEKSLSSFFLVTNVDLEFEANTLVTLVENALGDSDDVAEWECRQKPFEHPKHYDPVTGDTLWCSSACALFRTQALKAVNGYEPRLFMYGEDVELSYRLRDNGYRLRYIPKATVWHYTYEAAAEVKPMQFFGSTSANVLLRCRYGTVRQILIGIAIYLGLLTLPQQFPGQRWGLLKNAFKIISNIPAFLKSRKKSNAPFPFRLWDYAMTREGAFYEYTASSEVDVMPLVSVLIRTTPDRPGRLNEAIASVLAQTYKKIHLVVVEDGGDTAANILQEISEKNILEKVSYLPLPKGGRCVAGNAALAAAQGELVCFLDDDDLFYADHIEVLVSALQKKPELGAVYAWAYQVQTEVLSQEPWVYKELDHSLIYRQPFNRYLMWHHNYLPIQTVLFKRSLYQENGGFDPELDNLEDWNLWVRYSLRHDFEMVPKVTSLYRVPAKPVQASERQQVLDDYYAKAQEKHAQLRVEMSPPEILKIAETLSKDLYVTLVPVRRVRNFILRQPLINWMYHPLRKLMYYLRRIRSR
ncbi:glycosyltransferase, partial [Comamonas aquatica]|uniref:glycosyltransferase n=1 Tax=Comamonas aquatica TaxID=225991 RepID=UPI001EF25D45